MRIMIFGASGQIGRVIYSHLKNDSSMEVVGTSRNNHPGLIRFDPFKEPWETLGKTDVIINCIGQIERTRKTSFERVHVGMTQHILKNRELLGLPRIIQISALGADPYHPSEFLRTKGKADDLLLKATNVAVIRPSIVCIKGTMLEKKIKLLLNISRYLFGVLFVPAGLPDHKVQPVMPEDLAAIVSYLCKISKIPGIINLPGSERFSYRSLFKMGSTNRNVKLRIVELNKTACDLLIKNLISRIFPNLISEEQYKLLFEDNIGNIEFAEKLLGRPMESSFEFWENI